MAERNYYSRNTTVGILQSAGLSCRRRRLSEASAMHASNLLAAGTTRERLSRECCAALACRLFLLITAVAVRMRAQM